MAKQLIGLVSFALIVVGVVLIVNGFNDAHQAGRDAQAALRQLQRVQRDLKGLQRQGQRALRADWNRAITRLQNSEDGKPCRIYGGKGTIVVEGPTAASPGTAECVTNA